MNLPDILYLIIIYPITEILELIFIFSYGMLKENGISIIIISLAINILCLPLYSIADKWQKIERNVKKMLKPKISKIKKVFKGDEQYMILSTYHRQNLYHPIYALRSSLGLIIQIPFFIAAYSYLSNLELLNGTSFLFISDLSKPDKLLPIASGINLLPIFMTIINIISSSIYTNEFEIKEKIQLYLMSIIFLVLLYNSPSGLVLYWTMNNVFSLIKNGYLKSNFKRKYLFLYIIISIFSFAVAYHNIFLQHGNRKVRALIVVLSVISGITPWINIYFERLYIKLSSIQITPKRSLLVFVFSILILWAATGVFIPSILIGSSPQEFSFIDEIKSPLFFIFNTAIQAFGLCFFWPIIIFFLSSKNNKKIISLVFVVISLSALCNIFIFQGNYGLISNDLSFAKTVTHDIKELAVNTSFLIFFALFILYFFLKKWEQIVLFFSIASFGAIVLSSAKEIIFINNEFNKLAEYYSPESVTNDTIHPIFHLSKTGKNIFIIMLDMASSAFVPFIFEESPELYQKYEGFVFYPNTISFNGWTEGGAPPIFGGYEYSPQGMNKRTDISLEEKRKESLLLLPRLFSVLDFSVTITDPPYAGNNWIPDLRIYDEQSNTSGYITDGVYTEHWLKEHNIDLPPHSKVLKRNMLWYSILREIPFAFRQGLYDFGSWCSIISEYRLRNYLNGYAVLDYLKELTDFEGQKDNSAVIMVNNTTHEDRILQAPDYRPELTVTNFGTGRFNKDSYYHSNASAIKRLSEYFDFLKSNGVYDNTRIIMVSDHGCLNVTFTTKTNLPFHVDQFNPILFIKDFNAKGDMKTDMAFMSNADVPTLAMTDLANAAKNPFTGEEITTTQKEDPLLIIIHRIENKNANEIETNSKNAYYVHDTIFAEENWKPFSAVK